MIRISQSANILLVFAIFFFGNYATAKTTSFAKIKAQCSDDSEQTKTTFVLHCSEKKVLWIPKGTKSFDLPNDSKINIAFLGDEGEPGSEEWEISWAPDSDKGF